MNIELRNKLIDLFTETDRAHREAYAATGGEDPEWPIWYAGHLQQPLSKALDESFTQSQLIHFLMDIDLEREALSSDMSWPEYCADQFIEHYAHSETPASDRLVLYHYRGCMFCHYVISTINELGLDVELRDIFQDRTYRNQLLEARGRTTVPVLRIISPNGEERWMPESRDIVHYLETMFE